MGRVEIVDNPAPKRRRDDNPIFVKDNTLVGMEMVPYISELAEFL